MGGMFHWMLLPYRRYADFDGRSQRSEFWLFTLFYWAVLVVSAILIFAGLPWDAIPASDRGESPVDAPPGPLTWFGFAVIGLFWVGSVIPGIAVTVRRFHDQDKTGWLYLLKFIPYVGWIVVLVFMCIEGTRGPNTYGEDPKDPHSADIFD